MANLSKDLKGIFNKYLDRLAHEKKTYRPRITQPTLFGNSEFTGVIYFYEWSDATRTPKTFYTLNKFEDFIEESNIFLYGYQREIIRNMHNPYIACKKNSNELIIKATYEALKSALNTDESFRNPMAMGAPPIQKPKMEEPAYPYYW